MIVQKWRDKLKNAPIIYIKLDTRGYSYQTVFFLVKSHRTALRNSKINITNRSPVENRVEMKEYIRLLRNILLSISRWSEFPLCVIYTEESIVPITFSRFYVHPHTYARIRSFIFLFPLFSFYSLIFAQSSAHRHLFQPCPESWRKFHRCSTNSLFTIHTYIDI